MIKFLRESDKPDGIASIIPRNQFGMLGRASLCLCRGTDVGSAGHSPWAIEFRYARRIGTRFGGLFCALTVACSGEAIYFPHSH